MPDQTEIKGEGFSIGKLELPRSLAGIVAELISARGVLALIAVILRL